MAEKTQKSDFNEGDIAKATKQHEKSISDLENKIEDVDKCYSAQRYEEFQEAVKKITLETLDGAGREKIKAHAKDSVKEYNQENGWKKITFWLPTIISVIVAIVAIIALFLRLG